MLIKRCRQVLHTKTIRQSLTPSVPTTRHNAERRGTKAVVCKSHVLISLIIFPILIRGANKGIPVCVPMVGKHTESDDLRSYPQNHQNPIKNLISCVRVRAAAQQQRPTFFVHLSSSFPLPIHNECSKKIGLGMDGKKIKSAPKQSRGHKWQTVLFPPCRCAEQNGGRRRKRAHVKQQSRPTQITHD